MADGFASGRSVFYRSLSGALRPPSSMKPSDWVEKNREVPAGPHAGPWRNLRTPYLVEPLDCLGVESPYRSVTFKGSAQIGKTELPINWALYLAEVDPAPMLIAMQSTEKVIDFSDDKFSPSIKASKNVHKFYIADGAKSTKKSTTRAKRLASGRTQRLTSVLSSKNLQSNSIKYAAGDELGEWPLDVDKRGDPVSQIVTRQTAYEEVGAKSLWTSTPGVVGACLITELYERSDQRKAYLKCPHCGAYSPLEFEHMRGPDKTTGAHFVQQCCGVIVEHVHKQKMIESLVWLPCFPSKNEDNPAPPFVVPASEIEVWRARDCEGRQPGFYVWQAYSLFVSWAIVWTKWEEAEDNPAKLKTFYQQVLGLAYEEARDVPDVDALMAQRREFPLGRVPVGAYILTAGVDVQGDRLEFAVYGWGPGGSGYLVDKGVIPGDPELPAVWKELQTRVVLQVYEGPQGQRVKVKAVAVDSGYKSSVVYRFARSNPTVFAIDGRDGPSTPYLGSPTRPKGAACMLWPVGTHGLKSLLYAHLQQTLLGADPQTGLWPLGAQHFPLSCDETFFKQLTAESLVEVADRFGRVSLKWVKPDHARNEQIDLWVYARAMAEGMEKGGLSEWPYPGEHWATIIAGFGAPPEAGQLDLASQWSPVGQSGQVSNPPDRNPKPAQTGRLVLKKDL